MLSQTKSFLKSKFPQTAINTSAVLNRKSPTLANALLGTNALETVQFDIVHGCQLRCVGCPNSTLLPKIQRITVEDFDRCLRNIDVTHVRRFALFNYGEPLLHNELPALLQRVTDQAWTAEKIEISTNAQRVDWKMLEEAIKLRILTHFAISCDGDGTPADYEKLRPPAKWAKLIEFFERISGLRDQHHPELQVFTRSIVTSREARLRWEETLAPFGITPEFRGWMALPEAKENHTGRTFTPGEGICCFQQGNRQLYVDASGEVVPCCAHPQASVLGNLHYQTFSQISQGEIRRKFLEQMRTGRSAMSVCGSCEISAQSVPGIELPSNVLN